MSNEPDEPPRDEKPSRKAARRLRNIRETALGGVSGAPWRWSWPGREKPIYPARRDLGLTCRHLSEIVWGGSIPCCRLATARTGPAESEGPPDDLFKIARLAAQRPERIPNPRHSRHQLRFGAV